MHLNHPQTILPPPSPFRFMKKLSSMKLVPGAQKIGDHCSTTLALSRICSSPFVAWKWYLLSMPTNPRLSNSFLLVSPNPVYTLC